MLRALRRLHVLSLNLISGLCASGQLLDLGAAKYALHIGYNHFAAKVLFAYLVLAIVLAAELKPRSALSYTKEDAMRLQFKSSIQCKFQCLPVNSKAELIRQTDRNLAGDISVSDNQLDSTEYNCSCNDLLYR